MRQQFSFIDLLSIICFYLTVETMNDNRVLENHLQKQDRKLNKILEVLNNDSR